MTFPNRGIERAVQAMEREQKRKARATAYTFAFLFGVPILVALWAVAHMP